MDFKLSEDEELVQNMVREIAQEKFSKYVDETDKESRFPKENIDDLAELGLLGSLISPENGGAGSSTITYSIILEEIAKICASTSAIVSVTTMVGLAIEKNGTSEQIEKYVPLIAEGKTLGAFCLTEPDAGSDPASMKTTAIKEGDSFILNGQKLWITNAAHSDIFLIMAKEDPKLGRRGISAFILEKSQIKDGTMTIGPPEKKMGLNGSHTCAIFLDDAKIPEVNRIGDMGNGLPIALRSLDTGRIGIASQAIGIAQAAFDASVDYAKEREQFGKQIGKFQGISFKIADMKMKLDASRLLTRKAAWLSDQKINHTLESSVAKAYSTEAAFDITSQAIRIHGGMGYSKELILERCHRDVIATTLYEGTTNIQKIVIARELGL